MPKLTLFPFSFLFAVSLYGETGVLVRGRVELGEWPTEAKSASRYLRAPGQDLGPIKRDRFGVIWLEPKSGTLPPVSLGTYKMAQEGLEFKPYLLCVPVGATVSFPNEDDVHHNIFSYSPVKKFDLGRYLKSEKPPTVTFDKAGEVKLFCEVHKHMRASIFVITTPYHTRTDANGLFQIAGVLPGTYTLYARVDDKLRHEVPLEVKEGVPPTDVILALPKTNAP